jgi:hypothetical protein
MLFGQRLLRVDDSMKIRLHKIHCEIQICEFGRGWRWFQDGENVDHILMLSKVFQELELSKSTFSDCLNFERMLDFLDRDLGS